MAADRGAVALLSGGESADAETNQATMQAALERLVAEIAEISEQSKVEASADA